MFSTGFLTDKNLRKISRQLTAERVELAFELGLEAGDVEHIRHKYASDLIDQTFYILLVVPR